MKRAVGFILLSLAAVYLTACGGTSPSATPTITYTRIASVNSSASPSRTPSPPPTAAAATATSTATASATPGVDFSLGRIIGVAHLSDQRLMVSLELPGSVQGAFDGYIGNNYLPCETPSQFPNRIICVGPEPYINYSPEGALFELYPLYPDPQAPALFSGRLTVPARSTPTATEPVWYPPLPDLPGPTFP